MRKLFSANPAHIGRFGDATLADAIPKAFVHGTPNKLKADLIALSGREKVLHRAIDLVRYASDASPYRLRPQVVVMPRTTDDVVKYFGTAARTDGMRPFGTLWRWSNGGPLPIVVDAASCTLGLTEDIATQLDVDQRAKYASLKIIDSIAWCRDLLPNLTASRTCKRIALHPTCSTTQSWASRDVRGNRQPFGRRDRSARWHHLPRHDWRPWPLAPRTRGIGDARDQNARPAEAYLSANRTCEMGLRDVTEQTCESFLFLLEALGRPADDAADKARDRCALGSCTSERHLNKDMRRCLKAFRFRSRHKESPRWRRYHRGTTPATA